MPIKISIVPRGPSALGYTKQDITDKKLYTKNELLAKMCVLVGGRIGESFVSDVTTGASDDYEKLTSLAYAFVSTYCFTKDMGLFCNKNKLGDQYRNKIDTITNGIINNVHLFVEKLLTEHKEYLVLLANELKEKENLVTSDIDNLLKKFDIKQKVEVLLDQKN